MATTIQSFGLAITANNPINVRESAIGSSAIRDILQGVAGNLKALDIDNTANAAITYFRVYDNIQPTVGTTDPDLILMIPVSVRRTIVFPDGWEFTNFSFAAVTSAGTAGNTSPSSSVIANVCVETQ